MEVASKDLAIPSFAVNAWATFNITAGSDTTVADSVGQMAGDCLAHLQLHIVVSDFK